MPAAKVADLGNRAKSGRTAAWVALSCNVLGCVTCWAVLHVGLCTVEEFYVNSIRQ
jgi:hypothetical protein